MDDNDDWKDEEMDNDASIPLTEPTLIAPPKPVNSDVATTLPSEHVGDEIL